MTSDTSLFRHVIVGVDGSARAEEAARQGAQLAAATGAELDVIYVVDTGRPHDQDVEREAEAALGRATDRAGATGAGVDARIVAGDPPEALVEEAVGADLICVGPDAGLLGGAIRIGHVAAHVLRDAPCSVLLARADGDDFPGRILCGVDGSQTSLQTAALAAGLASATGAELRLLHVIPVFRGGDREWTLGQGETSPPELEPSVRTAAAQGVTPVREMAMGRPEHALVALADRDEADLLVVGHRGVTGVRRILLGSVSEHAAIHARCSVLVVRAAGSDEG